MSIPFEMSDTDDVNAANPCCCPESPCFSAYIEYDFRDSEICKGGWSPYFKWNNNPETYPNAFDLETYGKLVPLYKTSTYTVHVTISGTIHEKWVNSSDHVISETYDWNSSINYDFTTTIISENQKPLDEWPAGSAPLGSCPPEDKVFAGKATAAGVKIKQTEDPDDEIVEVTLSTPDVRPNHPTEVDEEGKPTKAGGYEWLVDGQSYGSAEPEFTIHLNKDDTTCHEFRVRHSVGGSGAGPWSKAKVFSVNGNPCCKEPEKPGCTDNTTGNPQWSASQAYLSDLGSTSWTEAYTNTSGGSSSQSGKGYGCDARGPTNVPYALQPTIFGGLFAGDMPLYWATTFLGATTVETGRSVTEDWEIFTWIADTNNTYTPDPSEPDAPGWYCPAYSENGTKKYTAKTTLSNDQNQGTSTVDGMFSTLLATVKAYPESYGWGITLGYGSGFTSTTEARAIGGYPESAGGTNGVGIIFARIREIRFRWEVPDNHDGTSYKTQWNIGRFHDRWVTWRGEYYEWAVKKYEFLQKPKPGDENYPKLSDFWNDPTTPENEAKEALKWAIEALDAIKDPGKAPEEPKDLKPEIISSPEPWVWFETQGEKPDERIDACDPTKNSRELHEPEKPKRDDFDTDEQFKAAVESYKSALAAYNTAVAARKAASKRQSPWYIVTPDKWSDYRGKPDPVQPLPENPDENDRKAHDRATKRYNFLLGRFNSTHHASLVVCNVRHTCNIGDPAGEIENWDRGFPTTELPPLDPTKEDPWRWAEWYQ